MHVNLFGGVPHEILFDNMATVVDRLASTYMLILTLKYTKTAQNYQDKKTNNIKIVILK